MEVGAKPPPPPPPQVILCLIIVKYANQCNAYYLKNIFCLLIDLNDLKKKKDEMCVRKHYTKSRAIFNDNRRPPKYTQTVFSLAYYSCRIYDEIVQNDYYYIKPTRV